MHHNVRYGAFEGLNGRGGEVVTNGLHFDYV